MTNFSYKARKLLNLTNKLKNAWKSTIGQRLSKIKNIDLIYLFYLFERWETLLQKVFKLEDIVEN